MDWALAAVVGRAVLLVERDAALAALLLEYAQIADDLLPQQYRFLFLPPAWLIDVAATLLTTARHWRWAGPIVLCYMLAVQRMCRSTLLNFLSGSGHGGLAIAYRRSLFRPLGCWAHSFNEQRGDFLNYWRPRAFQVLLLEPTTTSLGGGRHAVAIVNLHLNHAGCDRTYRMQQLAQVVAFAEGPEVRAAARGLPISVIVCGDTNAVEHEPSMRKMIAPADFGGHGYSDAFLCAGSGERNTWQARNPLTHGYLVDPDGRLDYIFFKGPLTPSSAPGAVASGVSEKGSVPTVRPRACRLQFASAPFISDHFGVLASFAVTEAYLPGTLGAASQCSAMGVKSRYAQYCSASGAGEARQWGRGGDAVGGAMSCKSRHRSRSFNDPWCRNNINNNSSRSTSVCSSSSVISDSDVCSDSTDGSDQPGQHHNSSTSGRVFRLSRPAPVRISSTLPGQCSADAKAAHFIAAADVAAAGDSGASPVVPHLALSSLPSCGLDGADDLSSIHRHAFAASQQQHSLPAAM